MIVLADAPPSGVVWLTGAGAVQGDDGRIRFPRALIEDTIARIKERVEEKEGIPPPQQRLIFGGKQMADDKSAGHYNVEGGSVLHLVLALRGGGRL